MAFLKRLGFYLIGLSIGIVFLTIFFKKKSEETGVTFCYLPNCRTLKDIRSKPLLYSEVILASLKNHALDTMIIKDFLLDGDVDFGKSITSSSPCKTYYIISKVMEKEAILQIRNCEKKAIAENIEF